MLSRAIPEAFLSSDFESFKRQESTFVVLNLAVLATLLLVHALFASHLGNPPGVLIAVLAAGFLLNVIELIWIQGRVKPLSAAGVSLLTWSSISVNMLLSFTLASLSYRQDTQYFTLMVVPVLEAAFRFSLPATLAVVAAAGALDFFWVWAYFRLHPPVELNEYFEAGTISMIYAIVGLLVWILVNHLRSKEVQLEQSLVELERAKERLLIEEKLAAVGRFSSAIAHEIRNPVAMISSALATAFRDEANGAQRQEMFEIAAKEASRLEKLTGDFLAYARPRAPAKQPGDLDSSIQYVADICRARAAERAVTIDVEVAEGLQAEMDSGQVQQALLNLVMNAVEASPSGGIVRLRGHHHDRSVRIDVENANGPIPSEAVEHIFEPFFTTKSSGTGLGLAIARNIARGHGGDLVLSSNQPDTVRFSMMLPGPYASAATDGSNQ